MQSFLEAQRGTVVGRKELLEVAITVANVRDRTAKEALKMMLERLGDTVATTKLPGQGQPIAYRLKAEDPHPLASLHQIADTPSGTGQSLGQPPLHQTSSLHQTFDGEKDAEFAEKAREEREKREKVEEVRRRWQAEHFEGLPLKLPVGKTDNLALVLRGYFAKTTPNDAEAEALQGIAKAALEVYPVPR